MTEITRTEASLLVGTAVAIKAWIDGEVCDYRAGAWSMVKELHEWSQQTEDPPIALIPGLTVGPS